MSSEAGSSSVTPSHNDYGSVSSNSGHSSSKKKNFFKSPNQIQAPTFQPKNLSKEKPETLVLF
jgi:hypothetical protein